MSKYSIAKLLKIKNRLANDIAKTRTEINRNNSLPTPSQREVNVRELLEKHNFKTDQLLTVKVAISNANAKIQEKIYRMAELKGQIHFYEGLPITDGEVRQDRYGSYDAANVMVYKAEIRKSEVMALVENLQKEIDTIQDDLDEFNATTRIELPFEL